MNILYDLLSPTRENIKTLECLRENAYQQASFLEEEKYYTERILSGEFLAYRASYDKEPVAGIYVSNCFGSLYIDQLFVKYEFQEKGYYFGKKLLFETLQRKKEIEEYFNERFAVSKIYPLNQKAKQIYESVGYEYLDSKWLLTKVLKREE